MTLNASYYTGPAGHPGKLLDDASLLLNGAHGIAQSLSDLLHQDVDINPNDLAKALWGVAVLIEMGQSSAEEANVRIRKLKTVIRDVDAVK